MHISCLDWETGIVDQDSTSVLDFEFYAVDIDGIDDSAGDYAGDDGDEVDDGEEVVNDGEVAVEADGDVEEGDDVEEVVDGVEEVVDGVGEMEGDEDEGDDEVGDEDEDGVVGGILVKTEDYVVVEVGAVGDSGPVSCRVVVGWLESREELGG